MALDTRQLKRPSLFRSLRHRPFALVWGGQTFSRVGDFLYEIALAWWVLEKTGSAASMATVLIFAFAPMLLFLLIGGVAGDRFNRVHLMLVSDLARGLVAGVVTVMAYTGQLEIWHVYVASLVFGFVDAFFQPAYAAIVPEIVPAEDLPSANSLTSFSMQAGRVLGPALGAGIVAWGGSAFGFAVNTLTFLIAAAFLLPLLSMPGKQEDRQREGEQAAGVLADVREGLGTVLGKPWLWISIVVFGLSNVTLAGPYSVAMPFLVKDHLRQDVETLGLIYAVFPIGYVLGGVWLGRKMRIERRRLLMYGGLAMAGLMLLLFGLTVPIAVLILAALVNGAALEIGNLTWVNTLQERIPNDKLGRVSSIEMLGSFALLPVGFGIAGLATDLIGPANVFVIGGGITALLGVIALLHPATRGLDRPEPLGDAREPEDDGLPVGQGSHPS